MHTHGSASNDGNKREQSLALLKYMVQHNKSHMDELKEFTHDAEGEAAEAIKQATQMFEQANAKLEEALDLLEKEE